MKQPRFSQLFLLLTFALAFFPQAVLFVKWTRYMLPALPFIYLIVAVFAADISPKLPRAVWKTAVWSTVFLCTLWALSYTITAYVEPDTRVAAAAWAREHMSSSASILSEVYDLGIVPFNASFPHITLFNTYDLDNASPESSPEKLSEALATADYFIMPSQRVLQTRLENPRQFPYGHTFYSHLAQGKLDYHPIYQTPCDLFCQLTYLGDPQFAFEQTASVFDRPTVVIWKKNP